MFHTFFKQNNYNPPHVSLGVIFSLKGSKGIFDFNKCPFEMLPCLVNLFYFSVSLCQGQSKFRAARTTHATNKQMQHKTKRPEEYPESKHENVEGYVWCGVLLKGFPLCPCVQYIRSFGGVEI